MTETRYEILASVRRDLIRHVLICAVIASFLFISSAVVSFYTKTPEQELPILLLLIGGGIMTGMWISSAITLLRIQKRITYLK